MTTTASSPGTSRVGNDLWSSQTQQRDGVGFQPPFAEAHGEAMEYASGLVELVRVANQYAQAGYYASFPDGYQRVTSGPSLGTALGRGGGSW
ncbi:MAG TPA: hypothetical protein VGJ38_13085 [Jatrophihabitantaceae bacterium]